jgi:hypothetical protein
MKIRQLERRVRKLESTLKCEPNRLLDIVSALPWFGVGYYLGNPSRDEKPFAAYARALGYPNESELNSAIEGKARELLHRVVIAEEKLFAKFDSDFPSRDWERQKEVLTRMLSGLPKSYRNHIARVLNEAKISVSWMRGQKDVGAYIRCFA